MSPQHAAPPRTIQMCQVTPGRRLYVDVTRHEIPIDLNGAVAVGLIGHKARRADRSCSGRVTHIGTTVGAEHYFVLELDEPCDGLRSVYVTDAPFARHILAGGE